MCRVDEQDLSTNVNQEEDDPTPSPPPAEVEAEEPTTPHKNYRTDPSEYDTLLERWSVRISNRPCLFFWTSLLSSLAIGMVGVTVGDFSVAVDNNGWYSRGTLIADRHQQFWLVDTYREALFADADGSFWDELENERQIQINTDDDDTGRRLSMIVEQSIPRSYSWNWETLGSQLQAGMQFLQGKDVMMLSWQEERRAAQNPEAQDWLVRHLQETDSLGPLEGCDIGWYNSSSLFSVARLWPVWKNKKPTEISLWDAPALQEMCEQEAVTQKYLEDNKFCGGCSDSGRCLQPYSPVLFARVTVENGLTLPCADLAQAWGASYQASTEEALLPCLTAIETDYNPDRNGAVLPAACPDYFFPSMLDANAPSNNMVVTHASSIFATSPDQELIDEMYDNVDQFGYGSEYMYTYYDTQNEDMNILATDAQILIDMALAVGSAVITFLAMIVHTRSPFLASVGLLQIVLSFPSAYFIYTFIARLKFFPFLNFIGVFVIFALGADDVFVAVDKWKNARLAHPDAPPQEIAAKAFPDAAGAMMLTTLTTAVAFFGTAVCPVSPILCFAVFVGLLVVMDYVLCCLLVFPALVIYDNKLRADKRTGCCCHCGVRSCCCCVVKRREVPEDVEEICDGDETSSPSLIHRVLNHYYNFMHRFRWPLLVACGAALVLCSIKAAQIELPLSADVRLFDESDNQFEAAYIQRQNLLFDAIDSKAGSIADVIWGVTPADTGNHNNPESWTKLDLDEDFDPSQEDVQDFATPTRTGYQCPMERLDQWLAEQASTDTPEDIYAEHCAGAAGLPIPQANFDACAYAWTKAYNVDSVLARAGKIAVMSIRFNSRVRFESPQSELKSEWNLINDWMKSNKGPVGAVQTSEDFWWFDTNTVMLETAYTSAGIALGAAAAVILFSSRSLVLTLYATITVGYVLTSVTAVLVAMGWTLGFLESILFAILIGISCDFVIHFSHSYTSLAGHAPRGERTRFALISMGPSILAAAFTTFAAALVMLFTVITFFEKFAVILFLTIAQSVVGSFVVFLVTVDCIGPSNPTHTVDHLLSRVYAVFGKEYQEQELQETQHFTEKEFHEVDKVHDEDKVHE
eukprot:scaffold983_cov168-Amphora_coffeaeformis.AAC.1